MNHWRNTCKIKSFVIPYVSERYSPWIAMPFATVRGLEYDTYDCVGMLREDGKIVKVRYSRRSKANPHSEKVE